MSLYDVYIAVYLAVINSGGTNEEARKVATQGVEDANNAFTLIHKTAGQA